MDNIFAGLSLIIAIGAAVSIFMRSVKQPLMIGYILTGIIVGPAVLHISKSPDTLTVFGEIGIALLLFIIGLGMSPRVAREVGRSSTITAISHMSVTGLIAWITLIALGLTHREALFVAIGLTINSTIVALKLLTDKREQGRLYGKLTVGISLFEDVIAAVLLLFVASAQNGQWLSPGPLLGLLVKGSLIGLVMYLISKQMLPRFKNLLAGDQELLFLTAIAIGLGSAALLAKIGFSMEVGALAAGVMLASQPYAQEVAARLRPLRDFFVIVFFIALGTELTFNQFSHFVWPLIAGVLIVVLIKPLTIMASLGFLGYTKRTSFMAATALSQVSEFSIIFVILANQKGLIDHQIVSLLTFIALISIAVSTYVVTFSDKIYALLEKRLSLFERTRIEGETIPAETNQLVLFGYQRGGHEFVNLFKRMKQRYVVVDYDPEVIDVIERRKINYLYGDATDEELLEEAGVERAKLIVSTIPDFEVNAILLDFIAHKNPSAVTIVHADDPTEAARLYEAGATYVILPHYIGSEKLSSFIDKSGLSKKAFQKERKKHLDYLEKHYGALGKLSEEHNKKLGRDIVKSVATLAKVKA